MAIVFADQLREEIQVPAEVERFGVGRDHDVAQFAGLALTFAQRDRGEIGPHVFHQGGPEAGPNAPRGIGMHVHPVGIVARGGFDADGVEQRGADELFDVGHGDSPVGCGVPAGRSGTPDDVR